MKSSVLIIAALLMLAKPAAAMSVDHDSNYARTQAAARASLIRMISWAAASLAPCILGTHLLLIAAAAA